MKYIRAMLLCSMLVLASCSSSGNPHGLTRDSQRSQDASRKELKHRAERYWTAKATEDWNTVFDYQYEPERRAQLVRQEFVDWSKKNEPLMVHSATVGDIYVDGNLGWVQVEYHSSVRRYPAFESRKAVLWQKWRDVSGEWYPIPQQEVDSVPETPAVRNSAEEARLRVRFDESFQARRARDWARLYEMTDPRDRESVNAEAFAEAEALFEYLAAEVVWVEVIQDGGRVQVVYLHKLTDKSMEKLGAREAVLNEKWVLFENQWYRDLKRR